MVGEGVGRERERERAGVVEWESSALVRKVHERCAFCIPAHTHCKFLSLSLDRGGLLQVFYYPSRSCCDYHSKHMTPAGAPRCDRVSLALPCSPCGHETTHGRAAL